MAKRHFLLFLPVLAVVVAGVDCGGGADATIAQMTKDKRAYFGAVPFEIPLLYQEGDKIVGPEADLAVRITDKMEALTGVELEPFWIIRRYATLQAALENDEVDFVLSVFGITEERKERLLFSDSYYASELVLVINPAHKPNLRPNNLDGQKIGVREGTAVALRVKAKYPQGTLVPMDTLNETLLALRRGEVDVVIDDRLMAAHALSTVTGMARLEIIPNAVIDTVECAVAIRKSDAALMNSINQAIKEMKEQDLYTKTALEILGPRLQEVINRHDARIQSEQRAQKERTVTLRVSRAANSSFDIYRFANLPFVLTDQSTGRSYTTSRIDFRGRTGVCAVNVPPGDYRIFMAKFNFSPGSLVIRGADPDRVEVSIQMRADGTVIMTRS